MEHITKQQYFALTKKKPKYKNKVVKNALGQIENHSKGENKFAKELYLELKAGKYISVSEQALFVLSVEGKHICNYKADFLIHHLNGSVEVIEYKGTITNEWRIKWKLMQALWPYYKYTLVRHQ